MAEPYVGEIRQFAGNFAPSGWMFCNGQIVSISDYEVLFTLIGTTYGGDGQSTFALPNLQSRVPVHQGAGYVLGQSAGQETVTLMSTQLPVHTHPVAAATAGGGENPSGSIWGTANNNVYTSPPGALNMNPASVGIAGGNQPHDNMHPFLALSYIISLYGIFPSQN